MLPNNNQETAQTRGVGDALKGWTMVVLTLAFVLMYVAALTGWLRPLTDERMVLRLEPIIFVIIGYYFGRLPAQQNEKTLKDEIARQTQKADAAQHAKEQALQTREAVEEKLKNVSAALTAAPDSATHVVAEHTLRENSQIREDALRYTVAAAINILNS